MVDLRAQHIQRHMHTSAAHSQRKIHYMYSTLYPASPVSPGPHAISTEWGEPNEQNTFYTQIPLGDQGVYTAMVNHWPELHSRLPLSWEVSGVGCQPSMSLV